MTEKISPERQRLNVALVSAYELLGQAAPSANALKMMGDALLSEASAEACELALIRATKEVRGRLNLPEILSRLPAGVSHPEPMEAYAIAVQMSDEGATVVTTDEIRTAYAATKELFGSKDAYGAREAFKSAYAAAVGVSRAVGKRPSWTISVGRDLNRREDAIHTAVRLGRISSGQAEQLLLTCGTALQLTHGGKALILAAMRGVELHGEDTDLTPEQREKNRAELAKVRAEQRKGNPEVRAMYARAREAKEAARLAEQRKLAEAKAQAERALQEHYAQRQQAQTEREFA